MDSRLPSHIPQTVKWIQGVQIHPDSADSFHLSDTTHPRYLSLTMVTEKRHLSLAFHAFLNDLESEHHDYFNSTPQGRQRMVQGRVKLHFLFQGVTMAQFVSNMKCWEDGWGAMEVWVIKYGGVGGGVLRLYGELVPPPMHEEDEDGDGEEGECKETAIHDA